MPEIHSLAFASYVLIAMVGLGLFVRGKLPALFAVALLSEIAYSSPLLFGFAVYPERGGLFVSIPLLPRTYFVNSLVLVVIALGGVWTKAKRSTSGKTWQLKGTGYSGWAALSFSVALLAYAIASGGSDLFSKDKLVVLGATGRSYSLAIVSAYVAVAFAAEFRKKTVLLLAFTILGFDLYVGFRAWTVMALVVGGVLYISRRTEDRGSRRKISWKPIFVLSMAAAVAFFYKGIFPDIKAGEFKQALSTLTSTDYYVQSIVLGEPFIVQAILNEVVRTKYSISGDYLAGIPLLLLAYSPELGLANKTFNDQFQHDLFPGTREFMGMGGNFWAEAISVGGNVGLTIYLGLFLFGLWLGSTLLPSTRPIVRVFAASLGVPWAFYIYRNELVVQLYFERQILLILVVSILMSMLWSGIANGLAHVGFDLDSKRTPDTKV